ncbi:hypothetical protein [Kitasatospora viridis]|uniref:PAS domain-containing protein n=1 Tax=Kitasatospora viridis TaxID=281105 RepID=A0A561UP63_9ACTN|nr:hypothetical protein [Kitasatospora viridis]TWG01134.1 hypothetical protein FHX73_115021 [Kitasatospora viridis]
MSHSLPGTATAPDPALQGWGAAVEWDLLRDTVQWSPAAYPLLARDPGLGPLTLDQLPAQLVPQDRPVLRRMVTEALVHGRPVEGVVRVDRGPGQSPVHCAGRARRGPDGQVVSLRLVLSPR